MTPDPHDLSPDAALTSMQQERVSMLSATEISAIDTCLLSVASPCYQKMAKVVGFAVLRSAVSSVPDVFFAQRVAALVDRGLLIARGDLERMRYCEIRLP